MKLIDKQVAFSRRGGVMPALFVIVTAASVAFMLFTARPFAVEAAFQEAGNSVLHGTPDTLTPKPQRTEAPDFTLTDANGKPITLSAYKGKVVLLDFWATWCGGCKIEIPWYMEFDKKYSSQGLAVLGVSMDKDGWTSVKPFLAKKKDDETGNNIAMQYPIVIGTDDIARQYNLKTLPVTLLIDREGKIAVAHTGLVDKDDFENNIRSLLK